MSANPEEVEKTGGVRTVFIFTLKDETDGLVEALKVFKEHAIQLQHIESRKAGKDESGALEMYAEVSRSPKSSSLQQVAEALQQSAAHNVTVQEVTAKKTPRLQMSVSLDKGETTFTPEGRPWFPQHISELDKSNRRVFMYGEDLDADHPGFNDPIYRKRRMMFAEIAYNYKYPQQIGRVEYTEEEVKTWGIVYRKLTSMYKTHACKQYLENFPLLEKHCGYREDSLPQLQDISNFLRERTGMQLRPVAGYLSSRDFLAGLAFRVFSCTQYIRHPDVPFYSPEPDCCHELLGHMPLFLDPSFAEFSQEIGLASLGASDEEVQKLATMYFFTVEFGLCKQNGNLRVYGAGLLSSVDELGHALSDEATVKPLVIGDVSDAVCQITTYQDQYFYTNSFDEAKHVLRNYAHNDIKRPFEVRYNPYTQTVEVLDKPNTISKALEDVKEQITILNSAFNKYNKI